MLLWMCSFPTDFSTTSCQPVLCNFGCCNSRCCQVLICCFDVDSSFPSIVFVFPSLYGMFRVLFTVFAYNCCFITTLGNRTLSWRYIDFRYLFRWHHEPACFRSCYSSVFNPVEWYFLLSLHICKVCWARHRIHIVGSCQIDLLKYKLACVKNK